MARSDDLMVVAEEVAKLAVRADFLGAMAAEQYLSVARGELVEVAKEARAEEKEKVVEGD